MDAMQAAHYNFHQQEPFNTQVINCLVGCWQNWAQMVMPMMPMAQTMPMAPMANSGHFPCGMGMGIGMPGLMAMPGPNGSYGFAFGPFPNVIGDGFQGIQQVHGITPFQGLQGFEGATVYAVPADQIQQMHWGMSMMNQEIATPKMHWGVSMMNQEMSCKEDWSPNGSNSFGYHGASCVEPEMPDALKDFVTNAMDREGCWVLQDLIPECDKAEGKFMADQLRGHVREVVESPHGNHVVQKMLEHMTPKSLDFVLAEMLAWAPAPVLARHRYACRVLERVLEHFSEALMKGLLEDLLYHATELCQHPFGTFVMQVFMEHAPASYRKSLIKVIAQNIVQVAGDHNACAVLEKGFMHGEEAECKMLVKSILKVEGLLPSMKSLRGGAAAIESVLEIATGWALCEAQRQLSTGSTKMIHKGRGRWRAQESGRPRRY